MGASYDTIFDPEDYVVKKIENIDNKPFVATIKNRLIGRTYDFVVGDYLGPCKIVEITKDNVVVQEPLSRTQYYLPVPIRKIEKEITKKERDKYKVLFDEAKRLFKIGKAKSAAEKLLKSIKLNPNYKKSHFLLAIIYQENKLYKDAFMHYKEVITIDPKEYRAYYNMAQIFNETENYKEALYYVRKALQLNPDYERGLNLYASVTDELEKRRKKEGSLQSVAARQKRKEKLKKNIKKLADTIRKLKTDLINLQSGKNANSKKVKKEVELIKEQLDIKKRLYDYQTKQLEKLMEQDQ
jgi:tetratricopeptide (TPR) repeat protein